MIMHHDPTSGTPLRLQRGSDRRMAQRVLQPPYITEEGLVLVDRRSYSERRQQTRGEIGKDGYLPAAA